MIGRSSPCSTPPVAAATSLLGKLYVSFSALGVAAFGLAAIVAMRAAAAHLNDFRLTSCDLWVTLEPCPMCAGAISHARIARLYYAVGDPKGGAIEQGPRLFAQPQCLHRPEVYGGLAEAEASALLRDFFAARR